MARLLKSVLLLLVLATTLVGCGSRKEESLLAVTGENLLLRVAIASGSQSSLPATQQAAINDIIRQNMATENVEVKTITFPYGTDIEAYLKSKDAPDVIVLVGRPDELAQKGALLRLDKVISSKVAGWRHALYKSAIESVSMQGGVYGVPRTLDPLMIAYKRAHFAAADIKPDPNWDWNDFVAVSLQVVKGAKAFYAQEAKDDKVVPIRYTAMTGGFVVCNDVYSYLPFLLSNGGGFLATDLSTILIDSKASRQALEWLVGNLETGAFQFDLSFPSGYSLSGPNLAASFGPAKFSIVYELNANENIYGVLPFPKSPHTNRSVTIVGTTMYAVNAYSPNIDLALDFVTASLTQPAQERLAAETGLLPARKDARLPTVAWLPPKEVLARVLDEAVGNLPGLIGNRSIHTLSMNDLCFGRETVTSATTAAAQQLRYILSQKDNPAVVIRSSNEGGFFGSAATDPIKHEHDPPAQGFNGVTLRWLAPFTTSISVPLVDAYNKNAANTGVYVRLLSGDDLDGYTPKGYLERSIAQGNPVDLVGRVGLLPEMVAKGQLEPLDNYLRYDLGAVPDGGIITQARYQGKLYALPIIREPVVAFVRQSAWDKAGFAYPENGWTWHNFLLWLQKAANPAGADLSGAAVNIHQWRLLFNQFGGRLTSGNYDPLRGALPIIKELIRSYSQDIKRQEFQELTAGAAVAYIGPTRLYDLRTTTNYSHSLDELLKAAKIKALPLPTPTGNLMGAGSVTTVSIVKGTPHLEAAVKFLKWLLSAEAAPHLIDLESGCLPVAMHPNVYDKIKPFPGPVQSVFPVPFVNTHEMHARMSELHDAAHSLVEMYVSGSISLNEAMNRINAQLPPIVKE